MKNAKELQSLEEELTERLKLLKDNGCESSYRDWRATELESEIEVLKKVLTSTPKERKLNALRTFDDQF